MGFPDDVKTKTLLWCDRHCCLCKKSCVIGIEVHHIVPSSKGGSDSIDNAIPLCFDCHGHVEHYNVSHPRGNKLKSDELKVRRDQVYEEFTRHLVPPIDIQITQVRRDGQLRTFPDIGFTLTHLGDYLPVRVRITVESFVNGKFSTIPNDAYSGKKPWNLNPKTQFNGHFPMSSDLVPEKENLSLRVTVSIIDQYEREHNLLPSGFVYVRDGNYWYAEPTDFG